MTSRKQPPAEPAIIAPATAGPTTSRATWKGTMSFGLVLIPVKLHLGVDDHDVSLRYVRRSDCSTITTKRHAAVDDAVVEYADMDRGYELPDGRIVQLAFPADVDNLKESILSNKTVDIQEFVPAASIDLMMMNGKNYYVEPEPPARKAYALLTHVLHETGKVAIGTITLRSRETVAAIREYNGHLVVQIINWYDEIRQPAFDTGSDTIELTDAEKKQALDVVNSMTHDTLNLSKYQDRYTVALSALIASRMGEAKMPPGSTVSPAAPANVHDMTALLKASAKQARENRRAQKNAPAAVPAPPPANTIVPSGARVPDMPLEEMDLTTRTYNCLRRHGVVSATEIAKMTEDDLLAIRNFGQLCLTEVKAKMAALIPSKKTG